MSAYMFWNQSKRKSILQVSSLTQIRLSGGMFDVYKNNEMGIDYNLLSDCFGVNARTKITGTIDWFIDCVGYFNSIQFGGKE
jgi:hypothetical protein